MAPHVGGRQVRVNYEETDQVFSRLVGKETGYESRDSRLGQTDRILSALVPVLLPRCVGDGHAGLLKSGEHLGLREGRRLRREVDVCVRIKSGTATSSSPSSTATWSGHAKMWSGPIVEGDHLVVGVVGALLGEHLHLLHVGRSLPRQAGGALRGGTAEPVGRWGYKAILIQGDGSQKVDPSFLCLSPVHSRVLLLDHRLGFCHLSLKEVGS